MIHYVYKIEVESGHFYIGSRSFYGSCIHRDKYMGSGVWCKILNAQGTFREKTILSQHSTREAANEMELVLLHEYWGHPLSMNRVRASTSGGLGLFKGPNPLSWILDHEIWSQENDVRMVWVTMAAVCNEDGIVSIAYKVLSNLSGVHIDKIFSILETLKNLNLIQAHGQDWKLCS